MRIKTLSKYIENVIPACPCQQNGLRELKDIQLKIKENPVNSELNNNLFNLLKSSIPNLKIISSDGKIILSHKLLLGLTSECMAKIFTHEDFVNEPFTILKIPDSSGEQIENVLNGLTQDFLEEDLLNELFFSNEIESKPFNGNLSITPTINAAQKSNCLDLNPFIENQDYFFEIKDEPDPEFKTDDKFDYSSDEESYVIDRRSPSKKFICPNCRKTYGVDYYKRIHQYKCQGLPEPHKEKRPKERKSAQRGKERACGDGPVSCDQCGKVVTNKYCLKIHLESVHNPDKQVYNCDQCPYTTTYKRNIFLHIKNIHEAGEFTACHICGVKIKGGATNLSRHIFRLHTESQTEKVKCEECGKEVKASQLINHKRKVHGERRFACHMCSYKAQTGYNLKLHISKSHLGVKELPKNQCQYCEVVTTNLPHHMKLFHGDK